MISCVFWVRVMELPSARAAKQEKAWQDARAAAADLIWSVQPKVHAEERKRLATLDGDADSPHQCRAGQDRRHTERARSFP